PDGARAGGARRRLPRRPCGGAGSEERRPRLGARPRCPGARGLRRAASASRADHGRAHAAPGRRGAQRRARRGRGGARRAHHAGAGPPRGGGAHRAGGGGRGARALRPPAAAGDRGGRAARRGRPPRAAGGAAVRLGDALRHGLHGGDSGRQVRAGEERALAHAGRARPGERDPRRRAFLHPPGAGLRRAAAARGSGLSRLWDKGEPLDDRVLRYTAGEDHRLDARLVPYDVRASIAHAEMLHEVGLLAAGDLEAIRSGLEELEEEHAEGAWEIALEDEDVHTALEARLTARIGEAGARVHLGRSRNDQVLAAVRLYLRDAVAALATGAQEVASALDGLGEREAETV